MQRSADLLETQAPVEPTRYLVIVPNLEPYPARAPLSDCFQRRIHQCCCDAATPPVGMDGHVANEETTPLQRATH
jgi:hypothetical protein